MATYRGYMNLCSNAGVPFSNAALDDVLVFTDCNTQSIHMGVMQSSGSNGSNAGLVVSSSNSSNVIKVQGNLSVTGPTTMSNTLTVTSNLSALGTANTVSNLTVAGFLSNAGPTYLSNTTVIRGATTISNSLTVTGQADLNSTIVASGVINANAGIAVPNYTSNVFNGSTTMNGTLFVYGTGNMLSNVQTGGTFYAAGVANFSNSVNISGATTISNVVTIASNVTISNGSLSAWGTNTISNLTTAGYTSNLGNTTLCNPNLLGATVASNLVASNIGINTSNSTYKLDVNGSARVNKTVLAANGPNMYLVNDALSITPTTNFAVAQLGTGQTTINSASNNALLLQVNNQTKAALTETGLGIGTTTPAYTLDVNGNANVNGEFNVGGIRTVNSIRNLYVNDVSCQTITPEFSYNTLGTAASNWGHVYATNGRFSNLSTTGFVGIGTTTPAYTLDVNGTVNASNGFRAITNNNYFGSNNAMQIGSMGTNGNTPCLVSPVSMEFYIKGDSFGTSPALTLSSSYNPLLKVDGSASTGTIFPTVDDAFSCGKSGNRWNLVYAVNGSIQTSDETEKDSVPLTYGLSDVEQITTIKYKWKSQADLPDDDPAKNYEYYGVCARELNTLFPELVYTEQEPYQLNYTELIPVMINAIKELSTKNKKLEDFIKSKYSDYV